MSEIIYQSEQSESIDEISAALAKAQAKMQTLPKDKTVKVKTKAGPSYSYKYTDLSTVIEATRKALAEEGIAVASSTKMQTIGNRILFVVVTQLSYGDQWMRFPASIFVDERQFSDPKSVGGTTTYLRRYSLCAALNLASDEDVDAVYSEHEAEIETRSNRRGGRREAGTFERPKRPKPPEQTNSNDYGERRRNQDKPSGRLRAFFDVEKFFPGLDENYVLKADDYCVSMLEESDTPVQGRTIADCKDWREAAIHFSRENNWAEWKDLNDHDRAIVLIAAELEKPADKKAA